METRGKERMQEHVAALKDAYREERQSAARLANAAVDTSKEAVSFADDWVRGNAWAMLAATVGFGLLIGLLIGRRRDEPDQKRVPR